MHLDHWIESGVHFVLPRYEVAMFVCSEDTSIDAKRQSCGKVWDSIKFTNCVES